MELIEESTIPEPKTGEVNFTDIMIRKGEYPDIKNEPLFTPGYDMVGVVDKTGKGSMLVREK